MIKKLSVTCSIVFVGALLTLPTAMARNLHHVTLMLNWYANGQHAAFYYGVKHGIYKEHGIDLKIEPGAGSLRTVEGVGAHHATFGWASTPSIIKGIAKGVHVKCLGVYLQKSPAAVQFFASEHIRTPADLKGKTIALSPGDALTQTFPGFLHANGLSMHDVKIVYVNPSSKIAALIKGRVDAIVGFFTDQGPTIEHKTGKKVADLSYGDWGVPLYGTGLLTSNSMIKKHPKLVEAFVAATIQSWEAAKKHPAEAVAAEEQIAKQLPPKSVVSHEFHITMSLLHTKNTQGMPPGVDSVKGWEKTISLLKKYAGLKTTSNPAYYWDGKFAKEAVRNMHS